ncbi:phage holin family protein [Nocardioides pantholopis]|uniref:phage holin family protein n=1 Tax=Nocardioides pantholopis TaxID=2483798 RepID=UPI000F090183|nr:phage holin family protein [Nocardioides pantholopis]
MRFLSLLASNAVALAVAAWIFAGIRFSGPTSGQAQIEEKILPLLVVAAILTLVTSLVKPVLTVLSIPFIIVTLGLFLLVINAGMLKLTGWIAGKLDLGFVVEGFWPAVGGAIVITIVTWGVDGLFGTDDRR